MAVQSQTPTHHFPPAAATWMMKPRWRAAPPFSGRPCRGWGFGGDAPPGRICKQLYIHRSLRRAEPLLGPRGG